MNDESRLRRRPFLLGVAGSVATLAGCSGGGGDGADGGDGAGGGDGTDGSGTGDGGSDGTATPGSTPTMSDGRLPAPVLGDPDASVTLAVYEDYACGHCVDYNLNGFPDIRADFIEPGDIRYEHRDAPIPVANPGSFQAASAAREVQARYGNDAFWDYAKKLFENSNSLRDNTELLFERLANELDFADAQAIADAGVNRAHEQTVQADRQMAQDVGVPGTPGFVINGTLVTSGFNQESLSTVRTELNDALSNRA